MTEHGLVMGFAGNLPASHFTPFLKSLRQTSYAGDVCVFVAEMTPADVRELEQLADHVVSVDADYPRLAPAWAISLLRRVKTTRGTRRFYPRAYAAVGRLLGTAPGGPLARDVEYRLQGIQALRYRHYLDYLEQRPDVERVMISDLRDVVFQDDPLAGVIDPLEVYLEQDHIRVAEPGFNNRWIRDLYGDDGVAELGDAVVSCSGVTIGTREGMLSYLTKMTEEVARHVEPLGPHDQGIHNWLLHSGRLPGSNIVANGTGRVLTMGAMSTVFLSVDGEVLNPDATRPAVVHQYDRHVDLATRLWEAVDR